MNLLLRSFFGGTKGITEVSGKKKKGTSVCTAGTGKQALSHLEMNPFPLWDHGESYSGGAPLLSQACFFSLIEAYIVNVAVGTERFALGFL